MDPDTRDERRRYDRMISNVSSVPVLCFVNSPVTVFVCVTIGLGSIIYILPLSFRDLSLVLESRVSIFHNPRIREGHSSLCCILSTQDVQIARLYTLSKSRSPELRIGDRGFECLNTASIWYATQIAKLCEDPDMAEGSPGGPGNWSSEVPSYRLSLVGLFATTRFAATPCTAW